MANVASVKKLFSIWRLRGVCGVKHVLSTQGLKLLARPPSDFGEWIHLFEGKRGLEIGGPSQIFSARGVLPIYPLLAALDQCNFSAETAWGEFRGEGAPVVLANGRQVGRQYLLEASHVGQLATGIYDFVLASHVLEHLANPVLAFMEWCRALKPGGALVIVVPRKEGTFDHRRPTTTWRHLLDDFENKVTEADLTHLDEILRLHDLARDPEAGTKDDFIARSENNLAYRCLHHHVFDVALLERFAGLIPLQRYSMSTLLPAHIVMMAVKSAKT